MKALPGFLIAVAFAALTCAVWALLNRPATEPPWPARIQGFAFSPFRNGEVDETAFQRFVDWQIREGTDALVPCGTTGESPTLNHDEQLKMTPLFEQMLQTFSFGTLVAPPF